jgi:tungstate transport system ATP-binding protein
VSTSRAANVLDLEGVRIAYGSTVVAEIERLTVHEGEILVVMGPNGSGKSSLLRVMGLLETPATGRVRFQGRPVARGDLLAARRQMASVFQDPLLVDTTVAANVALGLRFRRLPAPEITSRVRTWLERLEIAHLAQRRARTLSGGEAQRTALARALVLQPALLLLDEPFASLDQPTREALVVELGGILRHHGITTVLVTHDRDEAMTLGDRVAAMMQGRILQIDETARLFRAPVSEAVARVVGVETVVDCTVLAADRGLVTLDAGGQKVEVAAEARPGDPVRLCIRPEDVTLMVPHESRDSSARNGLPGTILRLVSLGTHVRVVVDCGFLLVALVTRRSVEDLGLAEGTSVIASFPATAAHVVPRH